MKKALSDAISPAGDVTELLVAWSNGDSQALETLVPLIYSELRRLARNYMSREQSGHTLQTTALVHEAYLRLINRRAANWRNRAHFLAASAQSMRQILVDMARSRQAVRRGGVNKSPLPFEDALVFLPERAAELVALDEALAELAHLDRRKCQIVEMRFFGGLSVEEVAEVLKISPETVMREWKRARAWLYCQLAASVKPGSGY